MKDKKENYVQVGEPQKGVSSTITYTGQPKWEKEFQEKFVETFGDGSAWGVGLRIKPDRETLDEIKDFIRSLLAEERKELKKKVERLKEPKENKLKEMREKSERLVQDFRRNLDNKEALEAVKYDENSQVVNVTWGRNEGYVTAIDDIITLLEE